LFSHRAGLPRCGRCFFDWAQRRIQLDADRFNALNRSHARNRNRHLASRFLPAQPTLWRSRLTRADPSVSRVRHFSRDDSASKHAERGGFCIDSHAELGDARVCPGRASTDGRPALGTAIICIRGQRIGGSHQVARRPLQPPDRAAFYASAVCSADAPENGRAPDRVASGRRCTLRRLTPTMTAHR
jgi:hypothetical protein